MMNKNLAPLHMQYERDGEWLLVPKPIPLHVVVRGAILNALAYTGGHQRNAAHFLGITERVMYYQMVTHNIPRASNGDEKLQRILANRKPKTKITTR